MKSTYLLPWFKMTTWYFRLSRLLKVSNIKRRTKNHSAVADRIFMLVKNHVYDTANHDECRAILQQFIKEIRVRKDYEISITLNASFNQVEQLKSLSICDGAEIFEEISEKGA